MNEERPPSKFGGKVWAEQGGGKIDHQLLEIRNDDAYWAWASGAYIYYLMLANR